MRLHPFLDAPAPLAFAHRGGACDEPENTLPAFRHAVGLGYRCLETDVHLTRDGHIVAFHDDILDRVTDRRGAIGDLAVEEVRAADAGYSFTRDGGRTFPRRGHGIRVPLLTELLEEWPAARVNLDAKSDAVVEPLADLLRRTGVLDRVCVGSFSDSRLRRIRAILGSSVCTSMGPRAVTVARFAAWAGRMPRLGADCLQVPPRAGRVALVDRSLVRAAHRAGLLVHVWTIDEPAEMERLLDVGVDGLMTDRPEVLRDVLRRRHAWHAEGGGGAPS
ncbi:MAG TPA: glycerophosphodiester phosphodiesterase [Candidatus Dormibacteraeota bacterium]|nr:glycerophosphodiester phosphodiesterase [Candidatus Dormibacteraeota bacterium]